MLPDISSIKHNYCLQKLLINITDAGYFTIIFSALCLTTINTAVAITALKNFQFSKKNFIIQKGTSLIIKRICFTEIVILLFDSLILSTDIILRSVLQLSKSHYYKINLAFYSNQTYALVCFIESILLFSHLQVFLYSQKWIKSSSKSPVSLMTVCYNLNVCLLFVFLMSNSPRVVEFSVLYCCNEIYVKYGEVKSLHHHLIYSLLCAPTLITEMGIIFSTVAFTCRAPKRFVDKVFILQSYTIILFRGISIILKGLILQNLNQSNYDLQDVIIFVNLLLLLSGVFVSIGFLLRQKVSSEFSYSMTNDDEMPHSVNKLNSSLSRWTTTNCSEIGKDPNYFSFKLNRMNIPRGSMVETSDGFTNSLFEETNSEFRKQNCECLKNENPKGHTCMTPSKLTDANFNVKESKTSSSSSKNKEKNSFPYQGTDRNRRYNIVKSNSKSSLSSTLSKSFTKTFNTRMKQSLNRKLSKEFPQKEALCNYDKEHSQRHSCVSYHKNEDPNYKKLDCCTRQSLTFQPNFKNGVENSLNNSSNLTPHNMKCYSTDENLNNNSIRRQLKRPSSFESISDSDESSDSCVYRYYNRQVNNSGRRGSCCSQTALLGNTLVVLTREKVFRRIQPIEKAGRRVGESRYQV